MTRRDYIRIAAALRRSRPDVDAIVGGLPVASSMQWERDTAALADALAADNPRFSRERFYAACEKGGAA